MTNVQNLFSIGLLSLLSATSTAQSPAPAKAAAATPAALTDETVLRSWGVPEAHLSTLLGGIPRTIVVTPATVAG